MILTPDQRLRVFLSSTLQELAEERDVARSAIEALRVIPVMFDVGARAHAPRALYRSYIEQSDIFIGVYWQRYGWIAPDMEISGVEDEYDLSQGMPRLIYVKAGEPEERLAEMLDRIAVEGGASYKTFETPAELAALIQSDLMVLLSERFYAEEDPAAAEDHPAAARLPAQPTPFIGRDRELKELVSLLSDEDARLVTLVGPGGIGKTRLALEAARRRSSDWPDGAYFVSLASLRDPDLVPDAVARALGAHSSGEVDPLDDLREFLAERKCLLILDNFEQLLAAAPVAGELLAGCPGLEMVVTSRAPLRIRGEHIYEVQPLAVPDGNELEGLKQSDAVKLFMDRAASVRPEFELSGSAAGLVAEICRRLDGLPLAIELAAVQMRFLTPERVLERLGSRLTALTGGARDMPERHQRLRDTIEWSYQLLDDDAKTLFARLGAFRGGFTLEAAETICGEDLDVLTTLSALLDHSLVKNESRGRGEPRFVMLETIREFARELLEGSTDNASIRDRHATYYSDAAVRTWRAVGSSRQREVLDRLDDDIDNMRAGFAWMLETGRADAVAHALLSTWYFWWSRSHLRDGRRWGGRVLEHELSTVGRARALAFEAAMAFWQSDYMAALPGFTEASALFAELNDRDGLCITDIALGLVQGFLGEFEPGVERIKGALAEYEDMGDEWGIVIAVNAIGWLQATMVRFDDTPDLLVRALELANRLESPADIGLAELSLARFLVHDGRVAEAIPLLGNALERLVTLRHFGATSNVIDALNEVAAREGRWEDAITLAGAADAIRLRISFQNPGPQAERIEDLKAEASRQLGRSVAKERWARGASMNFEEAVEAARTSLEAITREFTPA